MADLLKIEEIMVYNKLLNKPKQKLLDRMILRIVNKVRSLIVKLQDPLVKYYIGNFVLLLPLSHELPIYLRNYPYYSSNLVRIAKQVQEKYRNLKFIDIGANVGDSIAILRQEASFPILCIEGDDYYFDILQQNSTQFDEVYLEKAYLGQKNSTINSKSKREKGTSYLVKSEENVIKIKTLPDILVKKSEFACSKMLKIDTDGFDAYIIRGAVDFLGSIKPIIFFEYDPFLLSKQNDNDSRYIFSILKRIGYQKMLVYNNLGYHILSLDLDNHYLLEEIHNYLSGSNGRIYYDICAFHMEDNDLFKKIKQSEIQFFQGVRKAKSED